MINIKDLIIVVFVILSGVVLYQYTTSWSEYEEKIKKLEIDKKNLISSEKDLKKSVAEKEIIISRKDKEIGVRENLISKAEERIVELKDNYEIVRKSLFQETDEQVIALNFKEAFKATRIPSIRIIKLPEVIGATTSAPFMVLPVDYTKALTDTKNKYDTCISTNKELEDINELRKEITKLQDEKINLHIEIGIQYKLAYEEAFTNYMAMHEDFIETLESQRPDLLPGWLKLLAGVATGGLLCS